MIYSALVDEVVARSFPEGTAENLEPIYRKRVLDGLIEIQRWVPYFKTRQFNIVQFPDTMFRQGCTIICAPPGQVKRLATYVRRSLSDIVYYDPCTRNDLDRLLAAQSRIRTYGPGSVTQAGYFNSDRATDKGYRVERGLFCLDHRQLWIAPSIESDESIIVEWTGSKTSYSNGDILNLGPFDAQTLDALSLYVKKEAALREDRNTSDYVALTGRWTAALGSLKIDAKDIMESEYVADDVGELLRSCMPTYEAALDYIDIMDTVTQTVRRIEIYDGEFRIVDSPLSTGADAVWLRDIVTSDIYRLQIVDGSDSVEVIDPGDGTVEDAFIMRDVLDAKKYDLVVSNGEIQLLEDAKTETVSTPCQTASVDSGSDDSETPSDFVQQVFVYPGDPNGHVPETADKYTTLPLLCVDTVNHITWAKLDSQETNTGWGSP